MIFPPGHEKVSTGVNCGQVPERKVHMYYNIQASALFKVVK